MHIKNVSIKFFILLTQNEIADANETLNSFLYDQNEASQTIQVSYELFDDIYKLADKFEITKLIKKLDNIRFNDLDYAIGKLSSYNSNRNDNVGDSKNKIETILSKRKND